MSSGHKIGMCACMVGMCACSSSPEPLNAHYQDGVH